MSDSTLHQEWSSNRSSSRLRPQSTIARAFSDDLDSLFKIDQPSIADLDAEVFEKKEAVRTHNHELEALEARLRATEERLKNNGVQIPVKPVQEPVSELIAEELATVEEPPVSHNLLVSKVDNQVEPGTPPLTPSTSDTEGDAGEEEPCNTEDGESEEERPATADMAKRRKRTQSLGRRLLQLTGGTHHELHGK